MQSLLFQKLKDLGIENKTYHHERLYTVDQATEATKTIPGANCKNLFLKDDKSNLYLIVAVHDTKIDLKKLSKFLLAPGLRFANAELLKLYLGVEPGSVTPFGLIFDKEQKITLLLDSRLFDHELVGFHPLENNATTVIMPSDLKKFIESCKNQYKIINFLEIS